MHKINYNFDTIKNNKIFDHCMLSYKFVNSQQQQHTSMANLYACAYMCKQSQ